MPIVKLESMFLAIRCVNDWKCLFWSKILYLASCKSFKLRHRDSAMISNNSEVIGRSFVGVDASQDVLVESAVSYPVLASWSWFWDDPEEFHFAPTKDRRDSGPNEFRLPICISRNDVPSIVIAKPLDEEVAAVGHEVVSRIAWKCFLVICINWMSKTFVLPDTKEQTTVSPDL